MRETYARKVARLWVEDVKDGTSSLRHGGVEIAHLTPSTLILYARGSSRPQRKLVSAIHTALIALCKTHTIRYVCG